MTTEAERFFYEHGGWSYDPSKETPEQGRLRCARALAYAEAWAKANDVEFKWQDDWGIGSHVETYSDAYDEEPSTCEGVVATFGKHLVSLWCVDDADANGYRRVVEAEMADELLLETFNDFLRALGVAS